jgi:hypothetical protein
MACKNDYWQWDSGRALQGFWDAHSRDQFTEIEELGQPETDRSAQASRSAFRE